MEIKVTPEPAVPILESPVFAAALLGLGKSKQKSSQQEILDDTEADKAKVRKKKLKKPK